MKIKPIDDSITKKRIIIKVIVLTSLIISGLFYYHFFGKNFKKIDQQVLSEKTNKDFSFKKINLEAENVIKNLSKKTKEVTSNVLGEATKIYESTSQTIASKSSEMVNDLIFKSTIKPIVDQFEKLPEEQKEKVRETVCK